MAHTHSHSDGPAHHVAHAHSHGQDHHHHGLAEFGTENRAFLWAMGLNFGFTLIEAVYALFANSMSLLADAGHNFGDVLGLAFSWGASWLLTRPASQRYSYGYKKTTVLAAMANALLLVLATGVIVYESILRLLEPVTITESTVMIVAAIGIVINGGTALLFIKKSADDLNVKSAFLHLAADAVISVGVVITGAVVLWTHWLWLDPLMGLVIAITILVGTWGLIRDSVNLMLDAVPRHINQQKVSAYLKKLPGVERVHDLHIWGLSTREAALTAHLVMPDSPFSDQDLHLVNDHLRTQFRINHVTLQIERGHLHDPCGQVEKC